MKWLVLSDKKSDECGYAASFPVPSIIKALDARMVLGTRLVVMLKDF